MEYSMIKKQLAIIICLSFIFSPIWAAQQLLINGESGLSSRTKINANDTELYAHASNTSDPHSVTPVQIGAVATTGNETIGGIKTFTDGIVSQSDIQQNAAVVSEIATPTTPGPGLGKIYFKTDGKAYALSDGGTEYDLTNGASAATNWNDIGDATAPGEVDNGNFLQEMTIGASGEYRIGDGGLNYVSFTDGGMTLEGSYTFTFDITQSSIKVKPIGNFTTPITSNPYTLTAINSYNSKVYYGATGEVDLPAGEEGMAVMIYNTGAFTITIDPNGSEVIVRDGTAQTGGVSFTLSSGAGNFVCLEFNGTQWCTNGFKGTLTQGS
jgi:hypothetical protein